jgi:Protein of unknown function (DUF2815)
MAGKRTETPTSAPINFFARGRFLVLEVPKAFEEGQKPRWEATFVLDPSDVKQAADIKNVLEQAAVLAKEAYGKVPLAIKELAAKFIPGTKPIDYNVDRPDDIKVAFVDGDAEKYKDYAGYKGMFVIPAHNSKLRPDVVNRAGAKVKRGEPQYPYDGCNVRGSITIWIQTGETERKYGRRVGINLRGVQFVSDNQAFTQDAIDDEFEALEDEPTAAAAGGSAFD